MYFIKFYITQIKSNKALMREPKNYKYIQVIMTQKAQLHLPAHKETPSMAQVKKGRVGPLTEKKHLAEERERERERWSFC